MLDSAQASSSSAVTFLFAMTAEKAIVGRARRVRRSGTECVVIKPRQGCRIFVFYAKDGFL